MYYLFLVIALNISAATGLSGRNHNLDEGYEFGESDHFENAEINIRKQNIHTLGSLKAKEFVRRNMERRVWEQIDSFADYEMGDSDDNYDWIMRRKLKNLRSSERINHQPILLSGPSQSEVNALYDLYISTQGIKWKWKSVSVYGNIWNFTGTSVNPCGSDWQGVVCDTVGSTVVGVYLKEYDLNGTLPSTLSQLTNLQSLDLSINNLHGKLSSGSSSTLCGFRNTLQILRLDQNKLSGNLPNCLIWSMNQLQTLNISYNSLTGSIPTTTSLSPMTSLKHLSLSYNLLQGSLPSTISLLMNLTYLGIAHNALTGTLDPIFSLKQLQYLYVGDNQFHGHLPTSIYTTTTSTITDDNTNHQQLDYYFPYLLNLQLQNNHLSGTLSDSLLNPGLKQLIIFTNDFTGTIPKIVQTNLINVTYFLIDNNHFYGKLDDFLGNWKYLNQLTMFSNSLSGTLPSKISTFSDLQVFLVQVNQFTGSPSQAFNASIQKRLVIIDLSSNKFTGAIPTDIFTPRVISVSAFKGCFEGTIPSSICNAKNLVTLALDGVSSNCATPIWGSKIPNSPKSSKPIIGGIPHCLWTNMKNLSFMHLSGNGLTGSIPSLPDYGVLSSLDLSYNKLTGTIPLTLQRSRNLLVLSLKNNKLTGKLHGIGEFFENKTIIEIDPNTGKNVITSVSDTSISLELETNRLSGVIPQSLYNAPNIQLVSGNLFECSPRNPPPRYDSQSDSYVCGSDLLDISLWGFLGCVLIITTTLCLLTFAMKDIVYGNRVKWCSMDGCTSLLCCSCFYISQYCCPSCCLYKQQQVKEQANDQMAMRMTRGIRRQKSTGSNFGGGRGINRKNSANRNFQYNENDDNDDSDETGSEAGGGGGSVVGSTTPSMRFNSTNLASIMGYIPFYTSIQETILFMKDYNRLEQSVLNWQELIEERRKQREQQQQETRKTIRDKYHEFILNLVTVLWWRSKVTQLQQTKYGYASSTAVHTWSLQNNNEIGGGFEGERSERDQKINQELPNLLQFLESMRLVRRISIALMIVIVCGTVPLYVILKESYSTYYDQYRWNVSAVFMSGFIPAIAIFTLWATILLIICIIIDRYIPIEIVEGLFTSAYIQQSQTQSTVSASSAASSLTNGSSNSISVDDHSQQRTRSSIFFGRESVLSKASNASSRFAQRLISNTEFSAKYMARRVSGPSMYMSMIALLINMMIVLTLKACFLYLLIQADSSFQKLLIEFLLSFMDLIWDNLAVPSIITNLPKKKSTSRMLLKTSMLFFNSIVAPCIAIAVVDSSCFLGIFQESSPEYRSNAIFYCPSLFSTQQCNEMEKIVNEREYTPLFYYNYNCYSNIMNEYLPVFFISFIFLTFFNPCLAYLLINSPTAIHWKSLKLLPTIYFIDDEIEANELQKQLQTVNKRENEKECERKQQQLGMYITTKEKDDDDNEDVENSDEEIETDDTVSLARVGDSTGSSTSQHRSVRRRPPPPPSDGSSKDQSSTTESEHLNSKGRTPCMKRCSKQKKIFYPDFLLATLMHHMIVMLTFGVIYPPLAVAIAVEICMKGFTWEVILGRWMVRDGFQYDVDQLFQKQFIYNSGEGTTGSAGETALLEEGYKYEEGYRLPQNLSPVTLDSSKAVPQVPPRPPPRPLALPRPRPSLSLPEQQRPSIAMSLHERPSVLNKNDDQDVEGDSRGSTFSRASLASASGERFSVYSLRASTSGPVSSYLSHKQPATVRMDAGEGRTLAGPIDDNEDNQDDVHEVMNPLANHGTSAPARKVQITPVSVSTRILPPPPPIPQSNTDTQVATKSEMFADIDSGEVIVVGKHTRELESLCKDVGCGPRRCLGLISYGTAVFFGLILLDMAGDTYGWKRSIWAPICCMIFGTLLIIYLKSGVSDKQHRSYANHLTNEETIRTLSMTKEEREIMTSKYRSGGFHQRVDSGEREVSVVGGKQAYEMAQIR